MQNWEEQRELFPKRKRVVDMERRPRIRPNIYARFARYCAGNASIVLVITMFLMAVAVSFATFNAHFDLRRPVAISIDAGTASANEVLKKEFPSLDGQFIVHVSAATASPAKAAAQSFAGTLKADTGNIAHVFIPGVGPFYDRFGIFYLDAAEIEARVEHTTHLVPLFQALAVSPNLAGLSALVTQVATAVKGGRSPQGLDDLFLQVSVTIQKLAERNPEPLDWRAVAGLAIQGTSTDWAVIVEPRPGKLVAARQVIDALVQSTQKAQDALKFVVEYPPESAPAAPGSIGRQVAVFIALATLFLNLLLVFTLQNLRSIVLVMTPVLISVVAGFAAICLVAPATDSMIITFVFAVMLAIPALSSCMAMALVKPRMRAGSLTSVVMLASQDCGALLVTIMGISIAMWASWLLTSIPSLAALAVAVTTAIMAGLVSVLIVVPAAYAVLPPPVDQQQINIAAVKALVIWRKFRPLLAVLFLAVSLFCTVFFSSLHFDGIAAADVTRGVQFLARDEKSAQALVGDLNAVPEVGAVRWMGTFMPQDVARKRGLLQRLGGVLDFASSGAILGPHDPVADLQAIEVALRTISDEAGTNGALRDSAHQFRRSLAVLTNTTTPIEPAASELERLVFSAFAGLPKLVDDFVSLPEPQPADFNEDLRKLFISEAGFWRIEALPKRIIPADRFLAAVQGTGARPLGSLVAAQAELTTLKSAFKAPLAGALIAAMLMALLYLQRVIDWLIVLTGSLMPFTLFAALAVTTSTAIGPSINPPVIMAASASIVMSLLTVVRRRRLPISRLSVFLPVGLVMVVLLPLQLMQIGELAEFSRALTVLLICVVLFNLVVVQQLCAWRDRWKGSRPRLQQPPFVAKPKKDFSNNVF
jgi:hypothetical protein